MTFLPLLFQTLLLLFIPYVKSLVHGTEYYNSQFFLKSKLIDSAEET